MIIGNFKNILTAANDAYYEEYNKNLHLDNEKDIEFCANFIDECIEEERVENK